MHVHGIPKRRNTDKTARDWRGPVHAHGTQPASLFSLYGKKLQALAPQSRNCFMGKAQRILAWASRQLSTPFLYYVPPSPTRNIPFPFPYITDPYISTYLTYSPVFIIRALIIRAQYTILRTWATFQKQQHHYPPEQVPPTFPYTSPPWTTTTRPPASCLTRPAPSLHHHHPIHRFSFCGAPSISTRGSGRRNSSCSSSAAPRSYTTAP